MSLTKRTLLTGGLSFLAYADLLSQTSDLPFKVSAPLLPRPGRKEENILTTQGFDFLSETYKWLPALRKSIGLVTGYTSKGFYVGTAVLLDDEGTMMLCAHEVELNLPIMPIQFAPDIGQPYKKMIAIEPFMPPDFMLDLAFAKIDVAYIRSFNLQPVQWPDDVEKFPVYSDKQILVGFANGDNLHAEENKFLEYINATPVASDVKGIQKTLICNNLTLGKGYHGMSGGGVFDTSGQLTGMIDGGNEDGGTFLSITAIKANYDALRSAKNENPSERHQLLTARPECRMMPGRVEPTGH